MFKAFEVYRKHQLVAYTSDGDGTIKVSLTVYESILDQIQGGSSFDVNKAVFEHPNGQLHRTFEPCSGTSNRSSLEDLLTGPMNWFRHMIDLPQSYQEMVKWIEAFPDKKG